MRKKIMYIEDKSGGLTGPARIGYVTFSKTGRTIYYQGRRFQSLKGTGFKSNYEDIDTRDEFWISGPRKDGNDALYPGSYNDVEVDDDAAEEYWTKVRGYEEIPK